jgi:phospholipase C
LSQALIPSILRKFLSSGVGGILLPLLITGCSSTQVFGKGVSPEISISAKPASIPAGTSSTLNVTAADATQVTVTGSDGSSYNLQPNGGNQVVTPKATTTYKAEAAGLSGTQSASATLTVTSAPKPTITITAYPTAMTAGSSSVLTVTAVNATQVIVTGTNGAKIYLSARGGTHTVTPSSTTVFTATASGTGGTESAKTTVTVTPHPKPSITVTALPISITEGSSSVLTVVAKYATQVIVTGTNGSKFTLHPNGGTQRVIPAATTTYTATATGTDGTASAKTTVTVTPYPKPKISITAYPAEIKAGSSSILTVTAEDATQVILTGVNGVKITLTATGGKHAVSLVSTTIFTATATGLGGTEAAKTTVTVTPNPAPTVAITAKPASIEAGSSSTLTVTAVYATTVTVTGSNGSKYALKSDGGTQTVSPSATTTYTAAATGPGGNESKAATVTVTPNPPPSVTIVANPTTITLGNSSTLKVTATNATLVKITGTDMTSYSLQSDGGSQPVSPTATTTYTATATGLGGTIKATATVTVGPAANLQSIDHVIFMLQENHTFDNYFGMLNPYRVSDGKKWNIGDDGLEYNVDGIDDKLTISNPDDEGTSYPLFKFTSTCIDDDSSDWLASYGDVNRYDFQLTPTPRPILENGFVHTAEGYANSCALSLTCDGKYTDLTGKRAMGYYDEGFLNYYYYMASQFALSDRWFSPVASKSIDNRIATFTGGTTQGLTKDPANDDLSQLNIANIFAELDQADVSWKIYYTVTQGFCLDPDDCPGSTSREYPATDFSNLQYSYRYLYENQGTDAPACKPPTQGSSAVGDSSNSFCIDTDHIAPISEFISDLKNGTLPSFAFIEAGYGNNDEHPGSGQPILFGQAQVASILNQFMTSTSWSDSVFFLSYDEGGGPYDHVPPVPGHSNDYTDPALKAITPDIGGIAVNPDSYFPCFPDGTTPYCNCPPGDTSPSLHCDLAPTDPGATAGDAPYEQGFAAQLGFRVPNMVISPFARRHYVSHIPMDHTAVIKFVENRFIPSVPGTAAHLTARDAAQPDLLDFFDFNTTPWASPPTPPAPYADATGTTSCTPASLGP